MMHYTLLSSAVTSIETFSIITDLNMQRKCVLNYFDSQYIVHQLVFVAVLNLHAGRMATNAASANNSDPNEAPTKSAYKR